jgi:hypothetical protein
MLINEVRGSTPGKACSPAHTNLVAHGGKSNRKIDFLEDFYVYMRRSAEPLRADFSIRQASGSHPV